MYYYEVLVASHSFHGTLPLTYSSSDRLDIGQIVFVPLRRKKVTGIVVKKTTKPSFALKPVDQILPNLVAPPTYLALLDWMLRYYPAPSGIIVGQFLPSALLTRDQNNAPPLKRPAPNSRPLPPLTQDQQRALKTLRAHPAGTILLHGVTGSGKTRIYLEQASRVLKNKQQVLILTPEIGLTSPLVKIFTASLDSPVVVIHSNLTEKERREAWLQILQTDGPLVVIGPRSALFSPFNHLGLIVIDEAHDGAYKQDQSPHYQAMHVAGKLASLHHAQLLLGTATPSVADYFVLTAKQAPIIRLTASALSHEHPVKVEIVSLKERANFSRDPYLSDNLLSHLEQTLSRGEQALLFLNRRGTARAVLCRQCGWQALCPNCDLPLTYHGDKHLLQCHTCGFRQSPPTSCPVCGYADIVYRSIGTKALVERLHHNFPEVIVKRFDSDNLKAESFEQNYQDVASGKVDIIVGTQLLIKGHDLPKLSLVGVIAADGSLSFPDFSAEERTYQLLNQVIGRVGRGHRPGTAVIQTMQPENLTLQAALRGDWATFYEQQIKQRQSFNYPPFAQLLKLSCARASQASAKQAASRLVDQIRAMQLSVQVVGPAPRFIEKTQNKYHWQVIVKAKSRAPLLQIINKLPPNWIHDIDPTDLL